MKQLIGNVIIVLAMATLSACSSFEAGPEGLSVNVIELTLNSSENNPSVVICTAEQWDVVLPEWIKIKSIDSSNFRDFEWTVFFAVKANNSYDRLGTIEIKTPSYTKTINVVQSGVKGEYVSMASLSLNQESITLTEGDKYTLQPIFTPANSSDKTVSWSSSNSSVATVDADGVITAISAGTATITIVTPSGDMSAACSIIVNELIREMTISEIIASEIEGEIVSKACFVTAVNTHGFIASDAKKAISVYTSGTSYNGIVKIGDMVRFSGYSRVYNGIPEIHELSNLEIVSRGNAVSYPMFKDITSYANTYNANESEFISLSGILSQNGVFYNIIIDGIDKDTRQCSIRWPDPELDVDSYNGLWITVTGYYYGLSGAGKYLDIIATHIEPHAIPVSGVIVDRNILDLTEGESATLSATVQPSNATMTDVTWSSDKTSVATVSNDGVVTAVAPGIANITVTTVDGGLKSSCTVTVKARTVAVTGVKLNKNSMNLGVGLSESLVVTVEPERATNKAVSWNSDDETIATVDDTGKVTGVNVGSVRITVTSNEGGFSAYCMVSVKTWSGSSTGSNNGHDWVDLGLPSGIKWATCNVGASSPDEYGNHFAWGETSTKNAFSFANLKYCTDKDGYHYSKYVPSTQPSYWSGSSPLDNKKTLDSSDDAASVNWGGTWRMPTMSEMEELINNCSWTWTSFNGTNGYRVTSSINGNSIFLPAAGYRYNLTPEYAESSGCYWSSSLGEKGPRETVFLGFSESSIYVNSRYRYLGQTVRPVTEE